MNAKLLISSVVVALALVGCTTAKNTTGKTATTQATSSTTTQSTTVSQHTRAFNCPELGSTVHVKHLTAEQIQLSMQHSAQNYQATLTLAPSASGARYVSTSGLFGYGGEWHEKGNQAVFSYKGIHGSPATTTCVSQ